MNKQRVEWIDVAKGMAIILVILGHISFRPELLNVWLCSFHMPLFFFLAGITYNAEKYADFKVFLKNKIETLVIPYFIFVIISWLWNAAWNILYLIKDGTPLPHNTMLKQAIGIFLQIRTTEYGPGVWFIPCIFVAFILLRFIIRLSSLNGGYSKLRAMLLACVCLIAGYIYCEYIDIKLPWGIDAAFIAVFFMTMGNLLKGKLFRVIPINSRTIVMMLCLLVTNILFAGLNYKVLHRTVGMWSNNYGNFILFALAAISGVGFIILLSNCFSIRIFEKIGSRSIYYYGLHLLILNRLCGYIVKLPYMDNFLVALIASIVTAFAVLLILSCFYNIYEKFYLYILKRFSATPK